jgi:hypothetical protein
MESIGKYYTPRRFTELFLQTEKEVTPIQSGNSDLHSGSLLAFTHKGTQYQIRIDEYIQQYIQSLDENYYMEGKSIFSILADKHSYCTHEIVIYTTKTAVTKLIVDKKEFADITDAKEFLQKTLTSCTKHVISVGIYPANKDPHQTIMFLENGTMHYYDSMGTTIPRSLTFKYNILNRVIVPLFNDDYKLNVIQQDKCIQGYVKKDIGFCMVYSFLWLYIAIETDTFVNTDDEIMEYFTSRSKVNDMYNFVMYFIYIVSVENRTIEYESKDTIYRIIDDNSLETLKEARKSRKRKTMDASGALKSLKKLCNNCNLPKK